MNLHQKTSKLNTIINSSIYLIVFLVPLCFSFNLFFFDIYILPKQVLFHALLALSTIALLLKISINSNAINLRQFKPLITISLIFLFFILLSSLLSVNAYQSFWGAEVRVQGFYSYIFYTAFFIVLLLAVNTRRQINNILFAIYASSFLVCIIALAQYSGVLANIYETRLSSSLGHPNYLAHFLVVVIPLTIYGATYFKAKRKQAALCSLLVLQLFCLITTYSRAAWIAIIAVLFGYAFFKIPSIKINSLKSKKSLLILFSFILLAGYLINSNSLFVTRLKTITDYSTGSGAFRVHYWKASLQELSNASSVQLLFGFGPDTQAQLFAKHYEPSLAKFETINSFPGRAHNLLLDSLLQFGLLGSFLFALLILIIIKKAIPHARQNKLVQALLLSLLAHSVNILFSFSLVTSSIYLFLILAMLASAPWLNNNQAHQLTPQSSKIIKLSILTIIPLIVLAIYFLDLKPLKANHHRMQADVSVHNKNCQEIEKNFTAAILNDPKNYIYKEDYVFEISNCLGKETNQKEINRLSKEIINTISKIDKSLYTPKTLHNIAGAYSVLGAVYDKKYFNIAEAAYKDLIKINPYLTQSYRDLGRLNVWKGDCEQAIAYLSHALKITPSLNDPKLVTQKHRKSIEVEIQRIKNWHAQCSSYTQFNN